MRTAERDHYSNELEKHRKNLKRSWAIIKEVIGIQEKNHTATDFTIDKNTTSDTQIIADSFNQFFSNVGANLASKISACTTDPCSYIQVNHTESLFLRPTDEEELTSTIKSLKDTCPGWDGLPMKVIKRSYNSFIIPLTHVFNLSLSQGQVPPELKLAKVTPIYKSGDDSSLSNYRPISILPALSKILEKIISSRVTAFINKHNILHPSQYGFREHRNTSMALISLHDLLSQTLQEKLSAIGLFIDFRKAFDCVDHNILISKLEKYGIRGTALRWITNYLLDRKQYTLFNSKQSSLRTVTCGVPQGSILGPLLFLLYVNDFPKASNNITTILFADDANCFTSGANITNIMQNLNTSLTNIYTWTKANKLTINIDKTHYILFTNNREPKDLPDIIIDNTIIKRKHNTKFLGVMIDSKLSYKEHLLYIKPKIAKANAIISKAKRKLPLPTIKNLYYSFILYIPTLPTVLRFGVPHTTPTHYLSIDYRNELFEP